MYKLIPFILLVLTTTQITQAQEIITNIADIKYKIYPEVNDEKPQLPSPFINKGKEYVIAVNRENKYAIIEVSLNNTNSICEQLLTVCKDFPSLANTGLHTKESLDTIKTITGRTLDEITLLGRPNALSQAGFMAEDENILSVLRGDNEIVKKLGFTHPQMAKPLFHVLNMMDSDLKLNRWNRSIHKWDNIRYFYYNEHEIYVVSEDTKGGQKSIFDDNIEGAFYIEFRRKISPEEMAYLTEKYGHLSDDDFNELKEKLSVMNSGEMEPQYIARYGFYEGHTYWRTDPISISFIFGLKSLPEIDEALNHNLFKTLSMHYK